MEYVLVDVIVCQDSKVVYDVLCIYLLLNLDKDYEDKYNVVEIQLWVINDLGNSDSVVGFGGCVVVLMYIEVLFDGSWVVYLLYEKDEVLICQVWVFFDGYISIECIYVWVLVVMESEVLQEFMLVCVVGVDVGMVFVCSNGVLLDWGVLGIFICEGYWELFDK